MGTTGIFRRPDRAIPQVSFQPFPLGGRQIGIPQDMGSHQNLCLRTIQCTVSQKRKKRFSYTCY